MTAHRRVRPRIAASLSSSSSARQRQADHITGPRSKEPQRKADSNHSRQHSIRRCGGPDMQLYGSLADNLHAAINSNIRLRGRKVYPETVQYWQDLLHHARRQLATSTTRYASVEDKL